MTLNEQALELHEKWQGKLETTSKAPVKSRQDLSLAYTPGVAEPCKVIAENEEEAYKYTADNFERNIAETRQWFRDMVTKTVGFCKYSFKFFIFAGG